MNLRLWNFTNANKGQTFIVDGLFALIFVALLILVFQSLYQTKIAKENNELLKIQKINDLLITAQYLKIDDMEELEKNYCSLFLKTPGYIKINNYKKEINPENGEKKQILSNSTKYINNSNNKIYIEIGVYN